MKMKFSRYFGLSLQVIFFILSIPFFIIVILPYTRIRYIIKKLTHHKPSILWAPVPIINISHNRKADRSVGYKSDCLVYHAYHITQDNLFDYNLHLDKIYKLRIIGAIGLLVPFLTMIWASFKYDIFHFFFIGGFLYMNPWISKYEYVLWKIIGKKTITSAYGADVRLESVTRSLGKYHAYMELTHKEVVKEVDATESQIKSRLDFILRWSDACLSMGDMIEYTPGSINDIFYWAIDTDDWKPTQRTVKNNKVVIIHAPNHPHYKGTKYLLPTIERLKKEGYPIKFILIQKMTNEKARKYYEMADIVAEQFIIGWHGFFAVESMALGKPVLCYIRKEEYLPHWIKSPIINTNPDNLYQNLKKLITDAQYLKELSVKSRKYAVTVFSLKKVGERLDRLYKELY